MNELKRVFSNKEFLCEIIKDHIEEFKEIYN